MAWSKSIITRLKTNLGKHSNQDMKVNCTIIWQAKCHNDTKQKCVLLYGYPFLKKHVHPCIIK